MVAPYTLRALRVAARALSGGGGTCSGRSTPQPCPPCPPRTPLPCRPREPGPHGGGGGGTSPQPCPPSPPSLPRAPLPCRPREPGPQPCPPSPPCPPRAPLPCRPREPGPHVGGGTSPQPCPPSPPCPPRMPGPNGAGGCTCAGRNTPPLCPPCPPREPPPCRPLEPGPPRAVRVVCCPLRPKPLPPCEPVRTCITCDDMSTKNCGAPARGRPGLAIGGQDCVARRLQCARRTRQLDYESEVASRAEAPPPLCEPPPAPYQMGAERELARATDGRLYALPRTCASRPRCACDGTPPPPCAITLEEPDYTCHLGDHRHLDPCAHQPRVFVEIDRSASTQPCTSMPPCTPEPPHSHKLPCTPERSHTPVPPRTPETPCTAVILCTPEPPCTSVPAHTPVSSCTPVTSGTSLSPSAYKPSLPSSATCNSGAATCSAGCTRPKRVGGRSASDFGWCLQPPSLPMAPQRCRPITIVERLRGCSPRSAPRRPGACERWLHTSTANAAGRMQEMLRSREQLKEAGRGRVVGEACKPRAPDLQSPGGKLDMEVPPGTSKVRVCVFLDGADVSLRVKPPLPPSGRGSSPSELHINPSAACTTHDPRLSIKNLHKKFTGPPPKTSAPDGCHGGSRAAPPRRAPCPRRSAPAVQPPSPCNKPNHCSSTCSLLAHTITADPY